MTPPHRRASDTEAERDRLRLRATVAVPLRIRPLWRHQVYAQTALLGLALIALPLNGWNDVLRAVFLATGAFYLLLAALVIWVYFELEKSAEGYGRLLPRHVRGVAQGDGLKTLGAMLLAAALAGQDPIWLGIPLILLTAGVARQSYALGVMWRFQLARAVARGIRDHA